ncbi:MAG: VCBS repeat-containing protein [Verrucomicrobiae bacterium]|nr:VCBS repeat-containing protein [Verrucomicrobiae bacterium]
MSKRTLLLIAAGAFLLPFLAGGILMLVKPEWSPFGKPVFTEEIPAKRPPRLDQHLIDRHAGKAIADIIATAKAEREAALAKDPTLDPPVAGPPILLAMLPDAPLPFPGDVKAADEAGLKEFVTQMKSGPSAGPSTPEERWQFNLALAALGIDPADVPESIRMQTRPAPESDTYPVRLLPRPVELKGPVTAGDFDGGGDIEIVASGGASLFKVGGEGTLVALEGFSGVEPGDGLFPADFDGDGDLDLYVTRKSGLPDSLLRNEGSGHFSDETIAFGLLAFRDTTTAAWIDYDRDGRLDLLVGSLDQPLELYHQDESGSFHPVAWDLKLWAPRDTTLLAVADVDADGYPDLFLGRRGVPSRLLLSRPTEGGNSRRFEAAPLPNPFGPQTDLSSAAFLDLENDGLPDLLLATATPDPAKGSLCLLHNEGGGSFADVTVDAGLMHGEKVHSLGVADLDLDGFSDLLLGTAALSPDRVFANLEGTGFRAVTFASGGAFLDETVSWTTADLGGDGSADLLSTKSDGRVRWLEASGGGSQWLRVFLPEEPAGTRLAISTRDPDWVAETRLFTISESRLVTLGLGEGESIERLEVFRPGESVAAKTLESLKPGQTVTIELPPAPAKRPVVPMEKATGADSAKP